MPHAREETSPEVQRRETLRRARGRSKPAGEEEQVFHWWFIDTDLATMLQAAALRCGPCQDKIVETTIVELFEIFKS
jgi:hypothetical protein